MHMLLAAIEKPFIPGWDTPGIGMRPFAPELVLICTIVVVLLAPFFSSKRSSNVLSAAVSLVGLIIALAAAIFIGNGPHVGDHFRGLLVVDQFAQLWKILLMLFVIGIIVMWFATTAMTMHEGDGPEFFTLLRTLLPISLISGSIRMRFFCGPSLLVGVFFAGDCAFTFSAGSGDEVIFTS